jgi:hypothetical protein
MTFGHLEVLEWVTCVAFGVKPIVQLRGQASTVRRPGRDLLTVSDTQVSSQLVVEQVTVEPDVCARVRRVIIHLRILPAH